MPPVVFIKAKSQNMSLTSTGLVVNSNKSDSKCYKDRSHKDVGNATTTKLSERNP